MNTQGRRNNSQLQQPICKRNNKAIMMINIFLAYIVATELLTHQSISEKLITIASESQKQSEEWFKKNTHNELVYINESCDLHLKREVNKVLDQYTDTHKDSVYMVSIMIITSSIETYDVARLLFHAAELIKLCRKDHEPRCETIYGHRLKCWAYKGKECDDQAQFVYFSTLLYIEGRDDDYDLYCNYVSTYIASGVMTRENIPTVIIALKNDSSNIFLIC